MTPEEHNDLKRLYDECNDAADGMLDLRDWLKKHPPVPAVPVAELREWLGRGWVNSEFEALLDKYTPKPSLPPNPEKPGTYLWALEEFQRGRKVGRAKSTIRVGGRFRRFTWGEYSFTHADFIATDWEVVP